MTRPVESVWDYPRPPSLETVGYRVRARWRGREVANTTSAIKVRETSHPPVYYIPRGDVDTTWLVPSPHRTECEFKGVASYYSLADGDTHVPNAAWTYTDPLPGYEPLADRIAFYGWALDEASVDGEVVKPQDGHFYGGWITSEIEGPFKGAPGTTGW